MITNRGRFTLAFRQGYIVDASACRFSPQFYAVSRDGLQRYGQEVHAHALSKHAGGMELRLMASKIVQLSAGHFSFQPGEPRLISNDSVEVSSLLLDSCRQYDEDVRDGVVSNEYESTDSPPPPKQLVTTLADEYVPRSQHLYDLFKRLSGRPSPGDLSWTILQTASRVFERAILFLVTEEELQGVGGFHAAEEVSAGKLNAALALIRIPRRVPSVLEDVVDTMITGTGPAEGYWWARYIPKEFGEMPATDYVAMPIVADAECAMVLYGDTFTEQFFEDNLRALEVLNRHAGVMLENHRLRQRLGGSKSTALTPFSLAEYEQNSFVL